MMTETKTTESNKPAPSSGPVITWHGDVGSLVARRAQRLQETRDKSATVAILARLRANINREPGIDSSIWALTIEDVPGRPFGDAPTAEELAVHTALTLFAIHQQSLAQPVHCDGVGFGQAVRQLENSHERSSEDGPSPVRRRFDAALTADSLSELRYHLRGLINLMRSSKSHIVLDYGMLADDLRQFQRPGSAGAVRRRWARQFYNVQKTESDSTNPTTPEKEDN